MKAINGTWYGYCIDLLELIQKQMKAEESFTYEMYEVPDGAYGMKNNFTGEWSGVIGELQRKVRANL